MFSLRFRLIALLALTLIVGAVSGSAGVRSAEAIPAGPEIFTDIEAGLPASYFGSGAWGDYDNDGRLDVALTGLDFSIDGFGAFTTVYRNNGDGSFSEDTAADLPDVIDGTVAWGDYNNDGRLDLLVTGVAQPRGPEPAVRSGISPSGVIAQVYKNNGDGSFSRDTDANLTPLAGGSAAWADYDLDGRLDILITGATAPAVFFGVTDTVSPVGEIVSKIYRNKGNGVFVENTAAKLPGVYAGASGWGDFNLDGYPDVLLTGATSLFFTDVSSALANRSVAEGPTGATTAKIFFNKGDGSFSEDTQAGLASVAGGSAAIGDYNGDTLPDIALNGCPDIACATLSTKLYRNNGDGSFSENTSADLAGMVDGSLAWGDYDSDGRLDLALTGIDAPIDGDPASALYHNNGDGSFSENADAGLPHAVVGALAWADYNNDARLDLLVSGIEFELGTAILRNDSVASSATPPVPTGLKARLTGKRWITFSWDVSPSKTATNTVSYNLRVGTTPGGSDVVSAMADSSGFRRLPQLGNAEGKTFAKLRIINAGTYYWSVQAIGAGLAGSGFAADQKFVIPPSISLAISPGKINSCGKAPLSTTVTGSVEPVFEGGTTVVLQRRHRAPMGWVKVASVQTDEQGHFIVENVGRGIGRSFWLRAVSRSTRAVHIVSASQHVLVKNPASCAKPKRRKK